MKSSLENSTSWESFTGMSTEDFYEMFIDTENDPCIYIAVN
jgi:hypothetical protein